MRKNSCGSGLSLAGVVLLTLSLAAATVPVRERGNSIDSEKLGSQVRIPAGRYLIASPDSSQRPRVVETDGFFIDVHPVTNAQYLAFLEASGYRPRGGFDISFARAHPALPATMVTLRDARAYARHHGMRLPSEWEWEVVARSLHPRQRYIHGRAVDHTQGNFFRYKEKNGLMPVFSYPPNDLGVYGMAGNVFEWTESEYPASRISGRYRGTHRLVVLRGGAWSNMALDVTTGVRTPFPADRSLGWIGFRCVRDGSEAQ